VPAFVTRLMTEADRPALLRHAAALNAHEQAASGDRDVTPEGAEASLRHTLRRVAESGGATWVAETEGRVLGHLCLVFETMPPYVAAAQRRIAYIADLFVQEEARGQGAFQALLAEAERHAVARGATRLMIGVLAGNAIAERAYAKAGFRPYATELVRTLPPRA